MKRFVASAASIGLLWSAAPLVHAAEPDNSAMRYVVQEETMTNDAEGHFNPDFQMSRVEFVESVTRTFYPWDFDECSSNISPTLPPRFTKLFADVEITLWYAPHVCVGMFTGILNGNSDGFFRPYAGITAAEASKILSKTYGLTYPAKQPPNAPWYAVHMRAMVNANAIPATMQPDTILTRADVAQMFYALRTMERFPLRRLIDAKHAPSDATQSAYIIPVLDRTLTTGATVRIKEQTTSTVAPPTDTASQVRTRRAPRISRRQLLENIKETTK